MTTTETRPVLIDGQWREAAASKVFHAENPRTKSPLDDAYPVSRWEDCEAALSAADAAAQTLRSLPAARMADFLDAYAQRIEGAAAELVELAHDETALPAQPRLADIELPRTIGQLRQAAAAAREGSWSLPCIDTGTNIRSYLAPLGPICVFGPNNFPFAFNSIAGGDFAAAIAAGNPVIAKANSSHPATTRRFAEEALVAQQETGLPSGTVQLIYRLDHTDGERLVADARVGATGYTGSRHAGLKLKSAADATGKPIYLELSSINPVVVLPGALQERAEEIANEFTVSCLMGAGQFCTNPGIVLLMAGDATEQFITTVASRFEQAPAGTLLSKNVASSLRESIQALTAAGAKVVAGGAQDGGAGYSVANTLLRVSGARFLENPHQLQQEAFGNESLLVVAKDLAEARAVVEHFEGNLTGCIYSARQGADDDAYAVLESAIRPRVGRLLNDKMPTGVAVSAAMNHGGPYPATGHSGFTAVGIPASLRRFAMLQCYDNVRSERLPALLQDANPAGNPWRLIDGRWTQADVGQ